MSKKMTGNSLWKQMQTRKASDTNKFGLFWLRWLRLMIYCYKMYYRICPIKRPLPNSRPSPTEADNFLGQGPDLSSDMLIKCHFLHYIQARWWDFYQDILSISV